MDVTTMIFTCGVWRLILAAASSPLRLPRVITSISTRSTALFRQYRSASSALSMAAASSNSYEVLINSSNSCRGIV